MQSHIRKVHACLAVTCHLYFWRNDRGLLRATVVTWGLLPPEHTFFTMEGGDNEFANFTLPTLKVFLEARSQNVSGNKQ